MIMGRLTLIYRGRKKEVNAQLERVMSDEIEIADGDPFYLHPGQLALAVTREAVTLPDNIVGWLDGRSSLARLGLMVHVTAHRIDPGWSGRIVLEFYNNGRLPLALRPGMPIGALSFEPMSGSADKPIINGTTPSIKISKGRLPLALAR